MSLHRFAAHGWTERDVLESIEDVLRGRGFTLPDHVDNPPAYLAWLLRDLDPGQPPHVIEEARIEDELKRRAWLDALRTSPDCPHGTPGGDLRHPVDEHMTCPWCRRAAGQG